MRPRAAGADGGRGGQAFAGAWKKRARHNAMSDQRISRGAAIALIASGVLVGGTAPFLGAGTMGWSDPDLQHPPYGLFFVVMGAGGWCLVLSL